MLSIWPSTSIRLPGLSFLPSSATIRSIFAATVPRSVFSTLAQTS
jgi:hypothetical protein